MVRATFYTSSQLAQSRWQQKGADLFFDVQLVIALADGGAIEGVGLQDIGTRLQESRVDLLDHLPRIDHRNQSI